MRQIIISEKEIDGKLGIDIEVEGFDTIETIINLYYILSVQVDVFCEKTNSDKQQLIQLLKDYMDKIRSANVK